MKFVEYAVIAIVAFFAFNWLRNGISGSASIQAQAQPGGWGSGMIYAPGSAWQNAYGYTPYSMPQAYAFGGATPIYANYSDDNGFTFQYGR